MKASIIIPTYHRKESLIRLLALLKQEKAEIIVVEQDEDNHTAYARFGVRYFFLPKPGTVPAKNLGASKAHGDILFFFDDDVVVQPGIVAKHMKNYHDASVGAVVGRVITEGQPVEPGATNVGRINAWCDFDDHYSSTIKQDVDTVIGCNMSVRRDVFQTLGGFDETFTGPALRYESDLSLRVKEAGYRVVFDPTAEVRHLRVATGGTRKTEGRLRWYYHFFKNELYFSFKHRPLYILPVVLIKRIFLFL